MMRRPNRLVLFVPDFAVYSGAHPLFSEATVRAHAEVAEELGLQFVVLYLGYSLGKKLRSMLSSLLRDGFWGASPALNHFGGLSPFRVQPGDKLVVGFHVTWGLVRRHLCGADNGEVFLLVHNIESECRQRRRSAHVASRLLPAIEKWNVGGLRRLDFRLGGCYVGCLSWRDAEILRRLGLPSREIRYVGWTTLVSDEEAAAGRRVLASGSDAVGKTLFFLANGGNPDNRAGLSWFLERVAPCLRQPRSWKLVLTGPHWDGFDMPWPITLERVGFVDRISGLLTRGMVGINPDVSGVGVKTKMLDYCVMGLPAVSTRLGTQGLPPAAQKHLRFSDEPVEWAAMLEDLQDREQWAQYSALMLDLSSRYAAREAFVARLCAFLSHNGEDGSQPSPGDPAGASARVQSPPGS